LLAVTAAWDDPDLTGTILWERYYSIKLFAKYITASIELIRLHFEGLPVCGKSVIPIALLLLLNQIPISDRSRSPPKLPL
jgi:hypothetical protein